MSKRFTDGEIEKFIELLDKALQGTGAEYVIIPPDATEEEVEALIEKLESDNRTDN